MASANSSTPFVGIDIGSLMTFLVTEPGEIIRNELGGHASETLVGFSGKERAIGAAAASQASTNAKNTISNLHRLLGAQGDMKSVSVQYGGETREFSGEAIVAMLLVKLQSLVARKSMESADAEQKANSEHQPVPVRFAFALPTWYGNQQKRALLDAVAIAGIGTSESAAGVELIDSADCLCAVFARKHPVGNEEKRRTHCFIDLGHTHLTVTVARRYRRRRRRRRRRRMLTQPHTVLISKSSPELGVEAIDAVLFEIMAAKAQAASSALSLQEARAEDGLRERERMRKLLSTMPEAEVTGESCRRSRCQDICITHRINGRPRKRKRCRTWERLCTAAVYGSTAIHPESCTGGGTGKRGYRCSCERCSRGSGSYYHAAETAAAKAESAKAAVAEENDVTVRPTGISSGGCCCRRRHSRCLAAAATVADSQHRNP